MKHIILIAAFIACGITAQCKNTEDAVKFRAFEVLILDSKNTIIKKIDNVDALVVVNREKIDIYLYELMHFDIVKHLSATDRNGTTTFEMEGVDNRGILAKISIIYFPSKSKSLHVANLTINYSNNKKTFIYRLKSNR